jgi:hypothetical protein
MSSFYCISSAFLLFMHHIHAYRIGGGRAVGGVHGREKGESLGAAT